MTALRIAFRHLRATAWLYQVATEIAEAWREWAESNDGWFAVLHGEIVANN